MERVLTKYGKGGIMSVLKHRERRTNGKRKKDKHKP